MPGAAWRKPAEGPTGATEDKGPEPADWQEPEPGEPPESGRRLSASEVDNMVTDLEISLALDTSTRLSGASGGRPADAQSNPTVPTLDDRVVRRSFALASSGVRRSAIAVCSIVAVSSVAALSVQSNRLYVWFAVGLLFALTVTVGLLCHTRKLTV